MAKITLSQLKDQLAVAFPKMWVKDGIEFSTAYKHSLWTGEGSMIDLVVEADEFTLEMFDMYSIFPDMYPGGVQITLATFLEQRGFYAGAYDGGTFFIFEI